MECEKHPDARIEVANNAETGKWEYYCTECHAGIGPAPRPEDAPEEAPQ